MYLSRIVILRPQFRKLVQEIQHVFLLDHNKASININHVFNFSQKHDDVSVSLICEFIEIGKRELPELPACLQFSINLGNKLAGKTRFRLVNDIVEHKILAFHSAASNIYWQAEATPHFLHLTDFTTA